MKYTAKNMIGMAGYSYRVGNTGLILTVESSGWLRLYKNECHAAVCPDLSSVFNHVEEWAGVSKKSLRASRIYNRLTGKTFAEDFDDMECMAQVGVTSDDAVYEEQVESPKEIVLRVIADVLTGKRSVKQCVLELIDKEEKLGILSSDAASMFRKITENE